MPCHVRLMIWCLRWRTWLELLTGLAVHWVRDKLEPLHSIHTVTGLSMIVICQEALVMFVNIFKTYFVWRDWPSGTADLSLVYLWMALSNLFFSLGVWNWLDSQSGLYIINITFFWFHWKQHVWRDLQQHWTPHTIQRLILTHWLTVSQFLL